MKIVVTGSLGHIGKPLTRQLVREGHQVTVVSSSESRRTDIEQEGATAAIGSLDDVAFLRATCQDADAIFAMTPPNYTEVDIVGYYRRIATSYVEALSDSSVRRVVYLSSFGAHLDQGTGPILGSHHAEKILNAHKNKWALTHIRAGYFDYNLIPQKASIRYQGAMSANYGGDDMIPLVAPSDIARVAARELVRTADAPLVCYAVSQMVTANQIAQAIGTAIGKPELKWIVLDDEAEEEILAKHIPAHYAKALTELGASLHQGRLGEELPQDYEIGFEAVSFQTFVDNFVQIYQAE